MLLRPRAPTTTQSAASSSAVSTIAGLAWPLRAMVSTATSRFAEAACVVEHSIDARVGRRLGLGDQGRCPRRGQIRQTWRFGHYGKHYNR